MKIATSSIQRSTFKLQHGKPGRFMGCWFRVAGCWLLVFFSFSGIGQTLTDAQLASIQFEQKLNSRVSLDLPFRDEHGSNVRLGQYFRGKPVILVLGYYRCPMLCTLTLNGMVESLEDLKWNIGDQFDVINVSIDPGETPALAAAKKANYLKRYGRAGAGAGWHFLVGDDAAIKELAAQVGFRYAYDPVSKQYAHPSGLVILTPQGEVSHYLFGVTYAPKDLFASLQSASGGKVGSPIQNLILLCFHYNPIQGKYGASIMLALRIASIGTLLGLILLIRHGIRQVKPKPLAAASNESNLELTGVEQPAQSPRDP